MDMRKQAVDQSAHMLAAIALVLPLLAWPTIWTAILAGFGGGLIREITEPDPVLSGGSLLDISFWTIGGGLAWFIVHL